jgi:hypothetical protein
VLRRTNANPEAFRNADANRVSFDWTRGGKDAVRDELRLTLRDSSMAFLQHFLLGKPLERNGQRSVAAAASRAASLSESLQYRLGLDLEAGRGWLIEVQNGPTSRAAPQRAPSAPPADATTTRSTRGSSDYKLSSAVRSVVISIGRRRYAAITLATLTTIACATVIPPKTAAPVV